MPAVTLKPRVWNGLVALAKQKRSDPSLLAERAVQEFLQRVADEDLLRQSERAAAKKNIAETKVESIIRDYRNRARA